MVTRRNFLISAGSVTLGSALALSGCAGLLPGSNSGGGGGASNLTQKKFNGTLTLPAGTDLTKLKIVGPIEISKLTGNQFNVTGFEQFPSLVSVINPTTGKTILLGMIDPASSLHFLDAGNCAAALLFLALGGSQHFGAERQTFWTAILTSPGLANLTSVITTQMAGDLFALENSNSQIISALDAAAHGNSALPFSITKRNSAVLPKSGPATGRGPNDVTIFLGSPDVGQLVNGVEVINLNNLAFGMRTTKRRESITHLHLNGGRRPDWTIHGHLTEPLMAPIKMEALGATAAIPIAMYQTDIVDTYDLMHLTPVFDSGPSTIFDDGFYPTQPAIWRAELAKMYQRAEVGLVAKVLLEAVGMSGVSFTANQLDGYVTRLNALGGQAASLVLAAANGTGLSGGVQSFVQLARASDPGALDHLAAVAPLVQASNPVLFYDLSHRNYTSEQIGAFIGALRLIAYSGAMALSLELGAEYKDLTDAEDLNGVRMHFNCALLRVRLSPSGGEYVPGNNIPFTVTVDQETDPLTYKWSLAGISNATLDDGNGHTGFDIETDKKTVTLKTHANSLGNATVFVEAFKGTGTNRESVGSITTILTKVGLQFFDMVTFVAGNTTTVMAVAYFDKPHTSQGGNHYVGGRLRSDLAVLDFAFQGDNYHNHMEWPIPAFTGLPAPNGNPKVVGTHIPPDVGGGFSTYATMSVYDLGNRLAFVPISGNYYDFSSQADIDSITQSVLTFISKFTATALFP